MVDDRSGAGDRSSDRVGRETDTSPGGRRWLWWVVGIAAGLVFLYVTALPGDFAVGNDGPGLIGTYTVNGVDPTGAEYSGTAVIVQDQDRLDDGAYAIEWIITNAVQQGTGTVSGDTFTVTWNSTASASPGSGRTIYTIQPDGNLTGLRYVDGVDEPGTEELFLEP